MKSELLKNQCVKSLYQHIRNRKVYAGRCRFLDRLKLTNWHDPRWRQWWGVLECQRFWKWHAEERNALLSGKQQEKRGLCIIKGSWVCTYTDDFFWRTDLFSAWLAWCYCPLGTNKQNKGLMTWARSLCAVPEENGRASMSISSNHWTLWPSEGETLTSCPLYIFSLQETTEGTLPIQTITSPQQNSKADWSGQTSAYFAQLLLCSALQLTRHSCIG